MSDVYSDIIINNPQLESSIFSFDSVGSVSGDSLQTVVQIGSDEKVKRPKAMKSRNQRNNDMLNSDIANIPFLICSDDRP